MAGSFEPCLDHSANESGTSRWLFVRQFDRLPSSDGSPLIEQIVQTISQVWIWRAVTLKSQMLTIFRTSSRRPWTHSFPATGLHRLREPPLLQPHIERRRCLSGDVPGADRCWPDEG